ncbi:MAG: hypothetical protein ACRDY1_11800, partial [Acidimicrobiales bacterium]
MARGVIRLGVPLVVATVAVLLVFGAMAHIGPASGPDRRTVDRSFAVLAGPIVTQSNATGSLLNTVMRRAPSLERVTLFADLSTITTDATTAARDFAALTPPEPSADAAGRCGTTMADRERATGSVREALERLLGGPRGLGGGDEAGAARTLAGAGATLRSADGS